MWRIICRPDGKNPGWDPDREQPASEEEVNAGSIIVLITHDPDVEFVGEDGGEHEIARIGWVRRNSKNPGEELKPMVDKVIAAARVVIDALNDPLLTPGQRS